MIKLPDVLCDPLFEYNLQRGSIIRTLLRCHDGVERAHFFITISKLMVDDPLIFVVATSRISFYDRNPNFNKDIIRFSANELPVFPKPTIIDCRKIEKMYKDKLMKNFQNNVLEFVGQLPQQSLDDVDAIVRKSRFLSLKDKVMILGSPESKI